MSDIFEKLKPNSTSDDVTKSKTISVPEFIKQIEKEINTTQEEIDKTEALVRLKSLYRIYSGTDEVISTKDLISQMKNRPEVPTFKSGVSGLDAILGGFTENQLVVISAATKSGKTSFAIDMTTRWADKHPLWFSFEESVEELLQKFIDRGEEPPYFTLPKTNKGDNLVWIEKKIIEAIAKYNTKVVFIDHLHFIVPFSEERQDLRIGQTMRELKSMARRWGVTIFLIAHLKKTKVDSVPSMEDLRDSSFVAQEADTVLFLWRETTKSKGEVIITDNVVLSVQANRRTGKTGNVKMVFDNGHFKEQEWETRKPYKDDDDNW